MAKATTALFTSQSLTAAGTQTSSSRNLASVVSAVFTGRIVNGATGPTIPAHCRVEVSGDNSTFYEFIRVFGTTLASDDVSFAFPSLPSAFAYARLVFTGNTAQAVTIHAQVHEET